MNDNVFSSPLNANFCKQEKYAIKKEIVETEELLPKIKIIETEIKLKYIREELDFLSKFFHRMLGTKKK